MDGHVDEIKISHDKFLDAEDDSILDFKSPEQSAKTKLTELSNSNVHQKKKTAIKFKNIVKSHKEVKHKQYLEKKRNLQESQPSIESSFFKSKSSCDNKDFTTDVKVALVCPLCFKTFKDLNSRVLHMKICAYKNNIPTKKLIDAIELQKRQENERKSLGLPAAPIVQDKKKTATSHKASSCEETDLQLALALSKSLQEAEELDKINGIEGLSKISNQFMLETTELIYDGQLEKFGFANSKPPSLIRNKKRKKNEITLLQTRSQEERNRILTEKISEILMGNEPLTQNQTEKVHCNRVIEKKTDLRSHLLQKFFNKEERLWNTAKLALDQKWFYVSNLSKCIIPEENPVEEETGLEFANTCNMYNMKLNQHDTKNCSNEKVHETSYTELCFINEKCKNCQNRQFINTVITNWSAVLNDSSASDIIIFVNNNRHIWAHKLVFYVQCSNILLDVTPNDTLLFTEIKEKICWTDISYDIASAFLEFIYCGIINKYLNVLEDLTNFSFLRHLARKYKVKELFVFLQRKEVKINEQAKSQVDNEHEKELISKETDDLNLNNDNVENLIHGREDSKLDENEKLNEKYLEKYVIDKSEFIEIKLKKDTCTEKLLEEEIDHLSEISALRNSNASPDLFDDVNDTLQSEGMKNETKHVNDIAGIETVKNDENPTILDSVNQITFDTTNFSKFEGTTMRESIEENINLLPNSQHFTTPKRGDRSNLVTLKSNLSIFIEKFKRENAKSESDTDSEVSVLSACSKLCRNPFNVRQHDSPESKVNTAVKEMSKEKRDILSMFDCVENSKLDVTMLNEKNNTDTCFDLESVDNVLQLSDSNIKERIEEYKQNSTNESVTYTDEELQNEAIRSVSENSLKGNIESLENLQNEKDDDLFSDFDINEDEVSMYSKYKKGHENNSIIKYRNFVQQYILKNNTKHDTTYEYEQKNNTDNHTLSLSDTEKDSKLKTSPVKKYSNQTEIKQLISDVKEDKQVSQQNLCNLSNECVTNEEDNCLFTNITSPISTRKNIFKTGRKNNLSKSRYSKSENNIDLQRIGKSSFTSIELNTNKYNLVESPVLLSSSPELDYDILNVDKCEKNKMDKSVVYSEHSEDNNYAFKNDTYLADVYIDNSDNNSNISTITKEVNPLDEEIVSIVTTSENNKLITTNNSFVEKFTNNEKLSITEKNNKKFQRKSMSETTLHINTKDTKNDISKVYNNSQCKCSYEKKLNVTVSPEIMRDSVTPPPNYDAMKTPELHTELNKYGLKIQKRKRAVKLLTYIYNELHPTICTTSKNVESEFTIISSEDDEPPMKKVNCKNNDVDCVHNYESQLALFQENTDTQKIIDEEKQFNEPEFTPVIDNAPNIKDIFLKLLSVNKELYNKILGYEPLCINTLHSTLKTQGFRCKMNTLMDFLDEQCITFYVKETKQNKDKLIST